MHMDRAIFDLKASVGATSLYLLICALLDQGERIATLDMASERWNGTKEELYTAAEELAQRGVLNMGDSAGEERPILLNPREMWR